MNRKARGARAHQAGLAAEEAVLRWYQARGAALLARRWRCKAGEIDLILRLPDMVVFVEVKRRAAPLTDDPVTPKQWRRLEAAAETYIFTAETGETPVRFDLAHVGADGAITVFENARMQT